MANQIIYTPRPLCDADKKKKQCRNCAFIDLFISKREAMQFAEGGAKAAFKNERGEIVGYSRDDLKTFCSRTGTTVNAKSYSCTEHRWSDMIWAGPTDELTIC